MPQAALVSALSSCPPVIEASEVAAEAPTAPTAPVGGDLFALAPAIPEDAEMVASLYMLHGVMVGAFVLDLPKIRTRLMQSAAETVRQSTLTAQQLALDSAYGATQMVKQAAWSTGEACVTSAWQLSTWPMRSAFQVARLCLGKPAAVR